MESKNNDNMVWMTVVTTVCVLVSIVSIGAAGWAWLELISKESPAMPAMGGARQLMVKAVVVREQPVAAAEKYIARIEAIEKVDIESRIEGVIREVHFEEGAQVKKGDLLFTIESDKYEAEVALQQGIVVQIKADLDKNEKLLKRLQKMGKQTVTMTNLEAAESAVAQSRASLAQANANLKIANLNLGYTKIHAPINGKIGRNIYTQGNLVRPNSGVLVRIVQTDPVRVVFSATDRSYLKATKMIAEGFTSRMNVNVMLPDGTLMEEGGTWSFINNQIDSETGTIAVRAQFNNKKGFLIPGGYVKVFVSPANQPTVPVVAQNAVMNDRDGYYVFVVNEENVVEMRRVQTGKKVDNGYVIRQGLKAGEKVIVQGLQKVKSGAKVTVNLVEPAVGG